MKVEVAVNANNMIEHGLEPVSKVWLEFKAADLTPEQRRFIADRWFRGRILARTLASYQASINVNRPGTLFMIDLLTVESLLARINEEVRKATLTFPAAANSSQVG